MPYPAPLVRGHELGSAQLYTYRNIEQSVYTLKNEVESSSMHHELLSNKVAEPLLSAARLIQIT